MGGGGLSAAAAHDGGASTTARHGGAAVVVGVGLAARPAVVVGGVMHEAEARCPSAMHRS